MNYVDEWKNIKNNIDGYLEKRCDIDIEFLFCDSFIFNFHLNSDISTLKINIIHNYILDIDNIPQKIVAFINYLPNVDILKFNSMGEYYYLFYNNLQNLPITISQIEFTFIHIKSIYYTSIITNKEFNFLFNIKIPFNCKIFLNVIYQTYKTQFLVNKIDNNKISLLESNNKETIVEYCDDYTKNKYIFTGSFKRYTNFTMEII